VTGTPLLVRLANKRRCDEMLLYCIVVVGGPAFSGIFLLMLTNYGANNEETRTYIGTIATGLLFLPWQEDSWYTVTDRHRHAKVFGDIGVGRGHGKIPCFDNEPHEWTRSASLVQDSSFRRKHQCP
jgi:hypothetical protein